jgi:hypothetical protein
LWHSLNLSSMIISYASDEYLWQDVDAMCVWGGGGGAGGGGGVKKLWKVSFTVT